MDLLDIARGPGLVVAVAVFLLGTFWRLLHLWRRPQVADCARPRAGIPSSPVLALAGVLRGLRVRRGFGHAYQVAAINGYVLHIGLAVVVFGFVPHIAFVRNHLGLSWPALPNAVVYVAAGLTILSLIVALVRRLNDRVLKLISGWDDWISWGVIMLPFLTGMALLDDPSPRFAMHHAVYRGPLAVHLITLELLLIWLPFGKLMHAVLYPFARVATALRLGRRGVQA